MTLLQDYLFLTLLFAKYLQNTLKPNLLTFATHKSLIPQVKIGMHPKTLHTLIADFAITRLRDSWPLFMLIQRQGNIFGGSKLQYAVN